MKIVEVGHHCCVRLLKQAVALIEKGHDVHVIGFKKPNYGHELFKTYALCKTIEQLEHCVKLHADADIFHVHNEPNWLLPAVKRLTDKPVVFDVHDSMAYRSDKVEFRSAIERLAFEMADGLVFVSEPCKEITFSSMPELKDKPHCILPPYVNRKFFKLQDWQWVGGVVYEGRIDTDKSPEYVQYANYQELAQKFKELDIPFHIHTTDLPPPVMEYYKDALIESPFPYNQLLKVLGHYDWGLVGNIQEHKDWQVALPNKLFEYLAGGIPVVAMNAKEAGKFVEEQGIGISVKSPKELKERWDERARCQAEVMKKRFNFCMEDHIKIVEGLYGKVRRKKTRN